MRPHPPYAHVLLPQGGRTRGFRYGQIWYRRVGDNL